MTGNADQTPVFFDMPANYTVEVRGTTCTFLPETRRRVTAMPYCLADKPKLIPLGLIPHAVLQALLHRLLGSFSVGENYSDHYELYWVLVLGSRRHRCVGGKSINPSTADPSFPLAFSLKPHSLTGNFNSQARVIGGRIWLPVIPWYSKISLILIRTWLIWTITHWCRGTTVCISMGKTPDNLNPSVFTTVNSN